MSGLPTRDDSLIETLQDSGELFGKSLSCRDFGAPDGFALLTISLHAGPDQVPVYEFPPWIDLTLIAVITNDPGCPISTGGEGMDPVAHGCRQRAHGKANQ